MASVNKVILVGNCGRDPEVRYLPSGQAVANVSVATSSRRKDKNSGEMIEDTQWHRVTFYDRLAEIAGEYVKKGRPIYVEGRLKYGKYTDQAGVEKSTVDIIATELQLLGGRKEKIRAGDVLGALTGEMGFTREQIGKINVNDFSTYVAVDRAIGAQAAQRLNQGRVKGKAVKARLVTGEE